jgi:hypothetical protein
MSSASRTTTPSSPSPRSGIDFGTLIAAAIASVVAAMVVSRVWHQGTIMATAMTPVIVALVKEAVERPARRVSTLATRATGPGVGRAVRTVLPPPPEAEAPPPPMVLDPELSEMRVYRRERAAGRHWKLALVTGLLAFVVAAAVLTVPELVSGRSVVSGKRDTTVFGGKRHVRSAPAKPETTTTTTDTGTTSTQQTQPQPTTTTGTQPPATTTPAPQQTQTAPTPTDTAPAPTDTAPAAPPAQ